MSYMKNRKTRWEPTMNPVVAAKVLKDFLNKYRNMYSEKDKEDLDKNLIKFVSSYWAPIEFFQIYSHLGLFKDEDNMYYGYYKKLAELFDINCNVLDVASGYLPAFGEIVARKQMELPNAKGTITVCDPAIILAGETNSNMRIVRDKFDSNYDVSKYDLITGIMPCATTWDIIKCACENNKDFFIGLCGCPPEGYSFEDGETFLTKNIEYAKNMCAEYGREYNQTQLDPEFIVKMPVIYSKKR